jgi:hypothetical protein
MIRRPSLLLEWTKIVTPRDLNRTKRNVAKSPEDIRANYANYFEVGYNALEFVIDFGQLYEGNEAAALFMKIVTTPAYAKNLLRTLQESVEQYERAFGAIRERNSEEELEPI